MGARAALRVGTGLVTVASPLDAVAANAAQLTAIMLKPFGAHVGSRNPEQMSGKNAVLIGPGAVAVLSRRGRWSRSCSNSMPRPCSMPMR